MDKQFLKDLGVVVGIVVVVLAVIIAGGFGIEYYVQKNTCEAKAVAQGLDHKFGVWEGCIVKYEGKWIDYKRLRVIDVVK